MNKNLPLDAHKSRSYSSLHSTEAFPFFKSIFSWSALNVWSFVGWVSHSHHPFINLSWLLFGNGVWWVSTILLILSALISAFVQSSCCSVFNFLSVFEVDSDWILYYCLSHQLKFVFIVSLVMLHVSVTSSASLITLCFSSPA